MFSGKYSKRYSSVSVTWSCGESQLEIGSLSRFPEILRRRPEVQKIVNQLTYIIKKCIVKIAII